MILLPTHRDVRVFVVHGIVCVNMLLIDVRTSAYNNNIIYSARVHKIFYERVES